MDYLLKSSGLVVILFLFYYILLKNETFFKSIRSYFIIGLLIVLAIPLIEIPIYVQTVSSQLNLVDYEEITSTSIAEQIIDWTQIFVIIYLIGVVFFSVKFLIQLISLGNLVSKHQLKKQGKYYFAETSKNISPFSFFNIIIYNKSQFSIDELEHIINHEKAHVQQWHSIDTLLAHILVITLWFNPFVWLYKKAVQQNLEFLADAHALQLANNQKLYQLTLLKTCGANYSTEITNNFYNSLIKKRIIMLHKNQSTTKSQWKYALLLPLLTAFILVFNTKVIAQEKKLIEIEEISDLKVELIIDKNTTDEALKGEKETFKKQFDITLSFKGIKRNANNEITAIKIDAKGTGLRAKFENAGAGPIKAIKISYDSDNNSLNMSNISTVHKNSYSYTIHEDDDHLKKIELKGKHNKDGNFVVVTSDGKTKTWTSKGGKSKNTELKVIHKKGDGKNIWIHEKDEHDNVLIEVIELKEGEHEVKVIHENNEFEMDEDAAYEIKFHKEKRRNNENVFIFKNDEGKNKNNGIVYGNFVFTSDEEGDSLIFIDGKEISTEELKKIDTNTFEKMEVLKGKSATDKYGEKAKGGVILITTKKE